VELRQIHTTDEIYYSFVEKVLIDSFPSNEYRDLDDFRLYSDTKSIFHNNIILEKDKLVGLITYWDFHDFCYIEHFAIEKSMRGKGYGAFALYLLKKIINTPIVLEVELPINDITVRRIRFYHRQGFSSWDNYYEQPPYRPTDKSYPMMLMASGNLSHETNFKKIKHTIYKEVYNISDK
jgi:GNAT superfamily N-acetyltransferase